MQERCFCMIYLSQEAEEAQVFHQIYRQATVQYKPCFELSAPFGSLSTSCATFQAKQLKPFLRHAMPELRRDLLWELVGRPYLSVPLQVPDRWWLRWSRVHEKTHSCWRAEDTRRALLEVWSILLDLALNCSTDGNEAEPHLICVATSRNQNACKRPAIYFSSLVPWKPQCRLTGIELTISQLIWSF